MERHRPGDEVRPSLLERPTRRANEGANIRPSPGVHARVTPGRQISSVYAAFLTAETRPCPRFPPRAQNGKEGVDGTSPSEGFASSLVIRPLVYHRDDESACRRPPGVYRASRAAPKSPRNGHAGPRSSRLDEAKEGFVEILGPRSRANLLWRGHPPARYRRKSRNRRSQRYRRRPRAPDRVSSPKRTATPRHHDNKRSRFTMTTRARS
jgi:hypothetical protein